MAKNIKFEIYRGDSKRITVNYPPESEILLVNGYTWISLKLNQKDPDEDAVFQLSVPITYDPITHVGSSILEITPVDSADFDIRDYYYDIQVVGADPTELVKTLCDGKFKVKQDTTHSTS